MKKNDDDNCSSSSKEDEEWIQPDENIVSARRTPEQRDFNICTKGYEYLDAGQTRELLRPGTKWKEYGEAGEWQK